MKNKKFILIGCLIILLIVVIITISNTDIFKKNKKGISELEAGKAFFISNGKKDSEERFSLYSTNGKLLSNVQYKSASKMEYGSALVENEDGKFGIVNDNGKMIADFGKYEHITGPHLRFI